MKKSFSFLLLFLFIFTSCQNKSKEIDSVIEEVILSESQIQVPLEESFQKWYKTNKTLCVFLGYGYNSKEVSSSIINVLSSKYGLKKDGGLILPLVYPDDFKRGNKYYISELRNCLNEEDMCGVIFLGAPESSHIALSRLESLYNGKLPFPVFSFFSQDEVLGMEYMSDFVLDKALKVDISGMLEEESEINEEVSSVNFLEHAIDCMINICSPIEKNASLLELVKYIVKEENISRYVDADTGLYSINHFVLD